MKQNQLRLDSPPIVEAVVDIDCDMPPKFDLAALEAVSKEAYRPRYPHFQLRLMEEFQIKTEENGPLVQNRKRAVQAFQFRQDDQAQLVQVRSQGFSFNRLKPYTTLTDYLEEIESCWRKFVEIANPVQIRSVRMRYINRILLPLVNDALEFQDYIQACPQLPKNSDLAFVGFLNQHSAVELATGNEVTIVLTTQAPENDRLPIIFDLTVCSQRSGEVENWGWILEQILSLRSLKNRIFENTLTEKCLNLFRH
jgi:uncharacterized protein (TIGR04255 family)